MRQTKEWMANIESLRRKHMNKGASSGRGKYKSMTFTRVGLGTSLNYRSVRRQNYNNSNTSMFPRRSDGVGRLVNNDNTISSPSIPTTHDGAPGHSANVNGGVGDFTLYGSSVSGNGGGRNATGAGNSDFMHYPGGMKMAASGSTGQINTHRSSARGTLKKKKKRPQTAQPSSSRSRKPASPTRLAQMLYSKANNNNGSPNHTGRRSARPQTAGSSRSQRVEYAGSETRPKASARPQTAGPRRETIAGQAKQRVPSARPQTAGSGGRSVVGCGSSDKPRSSRPQTATPLSSRRFNSSTNTSPAKLRPQSAYLVKTGKYDGGSGSARSQQLNTKMSKVSKDMNTQLMMDHWTDVQGRMGYVVKGGQQSPNAKKKTQLRMRLGTMPPPPGSNGPTMEFMKTRGMQPHEYTYDSNSNRTMGKSLRGTTTQAKGRSRSRSKRRRNKHRGGGGGFSWSGVYHTKYNTDYSIDATVKNKYLYNPW